jgi:predicted nucleotidyltransferase
MQGSVNKKIIDYLIRYKPNRIGIFGSYARKEDHSNSDIDILIDFQDKISLFDLGGIKYDLSEILKRPVDIVTEKGLNKRLRNSVMKDLKIIYE